MGSTIQTAGRSARRFPRWVLVGVVVALDGLLKISARAFLGDAGVRVAPGVVLRVVENPRGPFGVGPLWFMFLSAVVVLVLFLSYRTVLSPVSFSLLVGGGAANAAERVLTGRTTDILVLGEVTAINLADLAVLTGLLLVLLPAFLRSSKTLKAYLHHLRDLSHRGE